MALPTLLLLILIGLAAGVASGMFGIGSGIMIVPALIYLLGYSREMAAGTSLAVLLPPVGIAAVLVFYRHGHVNVGAAVVLALCLLLGGGVGAQLSHELNPHLMKLLFGSLLTGIGCFILYDACR